MIISIGIIKLKDLVICNRFRIGSTDYIVIRFRCLEILDIPLPNTSDATIRVIKSEWGEGRTGSIAFIYRIVHTECKGSAQLLEFMTIEEVVININAFTFVSISRNTGEREVFWKFKCF